MHPILDIIGYSLHLDSEDAEQTLLDKVSFQVRPNEVVGLVGSSGAGKSMILKAILQLFADFKDFRQSGQILFRPDPQISLNLCELENMADVRREHIGLIFQQSSSVLNPSQTIADLLAEKLTEGSKEVREEIISDLLDEVELRPAADYMTAYPHQLSGGQIQRVLIALALVNNPQLILADEPFSALDSGIKDNLILLFTKLVQERELALLLVSHDEALIKQLATRTVYIESGQIVGQGHRQKARLQPLVHKKDELLMKVSHLTKHYGKADLALGQKKKDKPVFDSFDLEIYRGECLGIYGDSGSGKSTLARILLGLESMDAGSVLYGGSDRSGWKKRQWKDFRSKVQIIFQDPLTVMPPHRKVMALYKDAFYVMGERYDEAQIFEIWERLELEMDLLDRRPSQLSGGQRQRVLIGRALLLGAELLVCDEILASLDQAVADKIMNLMLELQRKKGLTLVLISHDLKTLETCCNRLVKL